jgi:hypothetical protein
MRTASEWRATATSIPLIFLPALLWASEENAEAKFFLALQLSSQGNHWSPGLATRGPELVRYRTQGLATYRGEATIGYGGPLFTLGYERPFLPRPAQQDMLAASAREEAGLEKFTLDFDLLPILTYRFPILEENHLLRTLLSVEFRYARSRFYGSAEVRSPFFYLPQDATVDWQSRTISGARRLAAGQRVAFQTTFVEEGISLSLWEWTHYAFRMGYFSLSWKRPSDNNYQYAISDGVSSLPILHETTYEASGVSIRLKHKDPARAGLHGDLGMRLGFDNRIRSAIAHPLQEHESLEFFGLHGSARYTWHLRKSERGLFCSLGASADLRSWRVDLKDLNGNTTESRLVDAEKLLSTSASVGWQF